MIIKRDGLTRVHGTKVPVTVNGAEYVARDTAEATQKLKTICARPRSLPLTAPGDDACAATMPGPTKSEYVFARRGAMVLGVGDEELGPPAQGGKEVAATRLPRDEKVSLLKKWVAESGKGL